MFDNDTIQTAGSGLTGWKSSTHSDYSSISSLLKSPTSSLYVNSLPGITVELASKAAKEQAIGNYLDSVHAEELRQLTNTFVHSVKNELHSKELLSNVTLIQRYNDYDTKATKNSRFVGYLISPQPSKSVKASISQIGFEMDTAQSLTIYLFESSQKAAIKSFTYTCSTADSLDWQDVTSESLSIEYDADSYGAGTRYLIGYFENDLSGQVYQMSYSDGANVAKKIFGRYMGVTPCYVNSSKLDGVNIPSRDVLEGSVSCKHPGFNLRFNVKCDITNVLVDNIQMLARPHQYAVAVRLLSDALANTELNPISTSGQNREQWTSLLGQYKAELYGGHAVISGIPIRKKGMMEELTMDFSDIDAVCLKRKDMYSAGAL